MTTKRNRTARFDIDRAKAHKLMTDAGARQLAEVDGPSGSALAIYGTARGCVIVQTWADGGCTHYCETSGSTWQAMYDEVREMMQPAAEVRT